MTHFAVSTSTHPLATQAIGEVLGGLLDAGVGFEPSFVFLSASAHHLGALEDILDAVHQVLGPDHLLGQVGADVIAGAREIQHGPAISILAGSLDGITPVRLDTTSGDGGIRITGLDATEFAGAHSLLLLADPASTPLDGLSGHIAERHEHLKVVGAGIFPGSPHRLLLGKDIHEGGAVGMLFDGQTRLESVAAPGTKPVSMPLTVTKASAGTIHELAGQPALPFLRHLVQRLQEQEPEIAASHLRLGLLDDGSQQKASIRSFSVDGTSGLRVGGQVQVGSVVQFHLMDAGEAALNIQAQFLGVNPLAALLFSSVQRGRDFFDEHDDDAAMLADAFHGTAVCGFRSALEINMMTTRAAAHQGTATAAMFVQGPL